MHSFIRHMGSVFFSLAFVAFTLSANAELAIADIFGDHMVLQQGQRIPVWGTATRGQKVQVQFAKQSLITTADTTGVWRVSFEPLAASATPQTLTVTSSTSLSVSDVLVGEVWFASGQSNMGYAMKACAKSLPAIQQIIDTADYPNIRYRAVKTPAHVERQSVIGDAKNWFPATPQTVPNYSAVAFLFACKLHDKLGVPIGIIETAQGGHPIEPFIPASAFKNHPVLAKERQLAKRNDIDGLREMKGGVYVRKDSWLPGVFFNARIAPVTPFAIRGAIWYQAESNAGKGEDPRFYAQKMKALFRGWRTAWNKPNLPIYYVQLPQYTAPGWTYMRDQQRLAMAEPNTGMAVTIDLALDQIHPANKIDVANRLALWPLAHQYGFDVVASGPAYKSISIKNRLVTVSFDHVAEGLVTGQKQDLKPTRLLESTSVHGFELADASGLWHPAAATITGATIVCQSKEVSAPVAVRYGWAPTMPQDKPWNLYNTAGLPASPFVSDAKYAPYQPELNMP